MKEEMAIHGHEGAGNGRMEYMVTQVEGGLNKQITLFFRSPTMQTHSLLYFRSSSHKGRDGVDRFIQNLFQLVTEDSQTMMESIVDLFGVILRFTEAVNLHEAVGQ